MSFDFAELAAGPRHRFKILQAEGGCRTCPRKRVGFVEARSNANAQVILVVPSPTATDPHFGHDPHATTFLAELHKAGLTQYALTHASHCHAPAGGAKERELSACMSQFVSAEVRPYRYVVLVGGRAASTFFPGVNYSHLEGNFAVHPDFPGQHFYTVRDPATLERNERAVAALKKQFERLVRVVAEGIRPTWRTVRAHDPRFHEVLDRMIRARKLSIDIEGNGLEPWLPQNRIKSVALADSPDEVLFVHESEPQFLAVMEGLRYWLSCPGNAIIGAHIGFDLVWFESELGIKVRLRMILDVLVLYYQLRGYQQTSVKELASKEGDGYRFLCPYPHLEESPEVLALYNGEDVVIAWKLFLAGFPKLRESTKELFLRVAGPSDLALSRIWSAGIGFDTQLWEQTDQQVDAELLACLEKWKAADPQFNPVEHLSDTGMLKYLFEVKRLPVLQRTATGKPSTDKDVIKQLIRMGATYLEHMLDYGRLEKIKSTYVGPLGRKHVCYIDGRVHSSYNNTATDTGRGSSNDPNLQNQPIRDPRTGPMVRNLFVARPGYKLLVADFSQAELRVGVSLANDPTGIQAYLSGSDLHVQTAMKMAEALRGDPHSWTKQDRTNAKPANFGLWYGGSWRGLQAYAAAEYGVYWTDQQAQMFYDLFFATYSRMKPYFDETRAEIARNKGWLEQAVGHVHYYSDWNSPNEGARNHAFRQFLNAKCQGPVGYICLYTLWLAEQALNELNINYAPVGTVHDSIMLEVPEEKVEEVAWTVKGVMPTVEGWCSWLKVPMKLDFEVGQRWGATEKVSGI